MTSRSRRRIPPPEPDWFENTCRASRTADKGPQHFLVGLASGFALGILTAVSLGWWPL